MDSSAEINRASWDERAPAHATSPGYARERFIDDPSFLSAVVRFDIPLLGDIRGLRGVHLQCHIGTDTISLARLGATMTGIDFSPASLVEARRLSDELQAGVEFVETDVYDAVAALGGRTFDLCVHRNRGALLAAVNITVGSRRRCAAGSRRAPVHARGAPNNVEPR